MVPVLAYQPRMNPKSLRRVAVVGTAAGWVAGWAVVGLEAGAAAGAAGVGCAAPGCGSAVSVPFWQAASVTAVKIASDATARRWVRLVMVVSFPGWPPAVRWHL